MSFVFKKPKADLQSKKLQNIQVFWLKVLYFISTTLIINGLREEEIFAEKTFVMQSPTLDNLPVGRADPQRGGGPAGGGGRGPGGGGRGQGDRGTHHLLGRVHLLLRTGLRVHLSAGHRERGGNQGETRLEVVAG